MSFAGPRKLVAFALGLALGAASSSVVRAAGADFDHTIAPLIARRCLDCHGGSDPKGKLDLGRRDSAFRGGESGPAIVPGSLDESLLWEKVAGDEMPPRHPLTGEEKSLLQAWIESGAAWGTDPIDPFQVSTSRRAGRDWWSLQPVIRPLLPDVADAAWCRTPIDRFVRAKLESELLKPAPEAERRTLIRRLTFDLIGLPPTPDELADFLADARPDAYERLVDRLLASPHFGVHQARRWLDLARYGESNGFEYDEFRPNAWRYRDWVVDAVNADMPYDAFARLQLAGDVLHPDDPAAVEATGFLAAAAYDTAGQNQQSAAMKAVVRQDELEDLIGTTGQTFLGLTLNCARCHDHKFDPVLQTEYYRVAAALAGVSQGERDISAIDPARKELQALQVRTDDRLAAIERPIRAAILAESKGRPTMAVDSLGAWDFAAGEDPARAALDLTLESGARLTPEGLLVGGSEGGYAASAPLEKAIRERTLEAWVQLDRLDQGGGAVIGLQTLDGSVFDAIVYGERQSRRWVAGSESFRRTRDLNAEPEQEAARGPVHLAITYSSDGTIGVYRNGAPYGATYQAGPLLEFAAGQSQVVFGLRHAPAAPGKLLHGTIVRARIYDRALTPSEVAESFRTGGAVVTPTEIAQWLTASERGEWEQLRSQSRRYHEALRASVRKTYSVVSRAPGETRVLLRGNPAQPGDVVSAGAIAAVAGVRADFGLPTDADDTQRRACLAAWITDPDNPLFSRVIVNRLWQSHFGAGVVETPSDFGFNGARPSHPELLDELAARLVEVGWSQKAIHRQIVTSSVYRQGGRIDAAALRVDSGNRWLWRYPPVRLEAEMVRDAMLATAGPLDVRFSGPSFQDYALKKAEGTASVHYLAIDPGTAGLNRRTLYRAWTRGGRSAFLDVLDCPDPSTTAPRRTVTNTPLQALTMMNNALVLHLARRFAERLEREAGPDPARQVDRAYLLALGRPPSDSERTAAAEAVRRFGAAVLARALYNSNAFLFVD
jgi:hypothetical protein